MAQKGQRAEFHGDEQHHGSGIGLRKRAGLRQTRHAARASEPEEGHVPDMLIQPHFVYNKSIEARGRQPRRGDEHQVSDPLFREPGRGETPFGRPDRIVERKADIFPVLLLESMVAEIPAERLAQVAKFDPGVLEDQSIRAMSGNEEAKTCLERSLTARWGTL